MEFKGIMVVEVPTLNRLFLKRRLVALAWW